MVNPKCLTYTNVGCWAPLVVAVDDAWFEGGGSRPLLRALKLGGVHKSERALSGLASKIEFLGETEHGDLPYLETIVEHCINYGFDLELCNFEWFKRHWGEYNKEGVAILLDINNQRCLDVNLRKIYGAVTIHQILNGSRPKADISVVTGHPSDYHEVIKKNIEDSTWWPLQHFAVISKVSDEDKILGLNSFAGNFSFRNQFAPEIKLLRMAIRASREKWYESATIFDDIPKDFFYLDLFQSDINSLRSLFHPTQLVVDKSDFPILASVLISLLGISGFKISLNEDSLASRLIHLPRAKYGVFWLIHFLDFLTALLVEQRFAASGVLAIESDGHVTIKIPLNPECKDEFVVPFKNKEFKLASTKALNWLGNPNVLHPDFDKLSEKMTTNGSVSEKTVIKTLSELNKGRHAGFYGIDPENEENILIRWKGIYP